MRTKVIADRFSMAGRRALVTDGSVSIGREISLAFAEAGADVAIHHAKHADAGLRPVRRRSNACRPRPVARRARHGHRGPLRAAAGGYANDGRGAGCIGGLDVLIVCASIQYRVPFADVTPERLDRQIQVNFKATVELLQAALPTMVAQRWARVLTIGSVNQTKVGALSKAGESPPAARCPSTAIAADSRSAILACTASSP